MAAAAPTMAHRLAATLGAAQRDAHPCVRLCMPRVRMRHEPGIAMIETTTAPHEDAPAFRVQWVFGGVSDVLRRQLVTFWLREGALTSADEAWRRSFEVACVLWEGDADDLAGVCTVAIHMDECGRSFGFVRIFIRPESRFTGLGRRMARRMIEGFSTLAHEPGAPQRLVATIENQKIARRGGLRLLEKLGFSNVGTAPNGELIFARSLVG
jgi:GNAT superfamily N-acetyltransferase